MEQDRRAEIKKDTEITGWLERLMAGLALAEVELGLE